MPPPIFRGHQGGKNIEVNPENQDKKRDSFFWHIRTYCRVGRYGFKKTFQLLDFFVDIPVF